MLKLDRRTLLRAGSAAVAIGAATLDRCRAASEAALAAWKTSERYKARVRGSRASSTELR